MRLANEPDDDISKPERGFSVFNTFVNYECTKEDKNVCF